MKKSFRHRSLLMTGIALLAAGGLLLASAEEILRTKSISAEAKAQEQPESDADSDARAVPAAETESPKLYESIPVSSFRVENLTPQVSSDMDYTDWWYSPREDKRYLFLPATADREKLILRFSAVENAVLKLNDVAVQSGEMTALLSTADSFSVTVDGKSCGTLSVMQSTLPCMYLSTSHGTIDYLDQYSETEEKGDMLAVDENGELQYTGAYDELSSHGNSSWDYSEKKPYNLKFSQKEKLYGMGKAKKWVLLSNYLDHSMLRNTIMTDMAEAAGIDFTMQYTYLDLYVDGSYRGTYQLYEKVQVQSHRVNIKDLEEEMEAINPSPLKSYPRIADGGDLDGYLENTCKYYDIPNNPEDITGGYLLQFQLWNRYGEKAKSGFVTSRGQAVEIDGPEYASKAQAEYIRNFVQELEDAIYSETGYNAKGKHYSDYLDMDSLTAAYLLQEISQNIDGCTTSFYFWKESDETGDGKLHCGPCWDFDFTFYNFITSRENAEGDKATTGDANALFAICFPISGYDADLTDGEGSGRPAAGMSWLAQLYRHGDLEQRAAKMFFSVFDDYLEKLSLPDNPEQSELMLLGEELRPSAEMNNARWNMVGDNRQFGPVQGETFMECVDWLRNRVALRREGLQKIWAEEGARQLEEELQLTVDSLPLSRYDDAELAELQALLQEAKENILAAGAEQDYAQAQALFEEAQNGIQKIPRRLLAGDFNDDLTVDIMDAQELLRYYCRKLALFDDPEPDATAFRNGDMNADGKLDALDALAVLRQVAQTALNIL